MKPFFYSTRNDRISIFMALVVIAVVIGVIVFEQMHPEGTVPSAAIGTDSSSLRQGTAARTTNNGSYYYPETAARELFTFDPNTADSTQLLRLGLRPWQVRNIYKYRSKGGKYRRKEDFARLYGLTAADYKRLEPYIRITEDMRPAAEVYVTETPKATVRDTLRYPLKLKTGEHIALNAADTTLLKRVPGVGSHYASAIVKLRQRLGGYYSTSQLLEIDGFPETALPYFTVDASQCRQVNLNKATLSQLRQHPYIGFYMARTIVEHRRLHGRITSLNELKTYRDFTPEVITRLQHYVTF